MPSIVIDPAPTPSGSTAGGPIIGGVAFRRPATRGESWEAVGSDQQLANGNTRSYRQGQRAVVSLTWAKLLEADVATLKAVVAPAVTTYQADADAEEIAMTTGDGVSAEAIAGTFPVRYSASLTLKARDVTA